MSAGISAATAFSVLGPTIIGGLLGGSSSGSAQGGTTTETKGPWAEAAPWLKQNLQTGQNLQNYYQKNPFNAQQQNAYSNLSQGTRYMNALTPNLMAQFSQQQGFDRTNPRRGPMAINFQANPGSMQEPGPGGNLGFGGVPAQSAPMPMSNAYASMPPPAPPPVAPQMDDAEFSRRMAAYNAMNPAMQDTRGG
jgi:hypothetical protein